MPPVTPSSTAERGLTEASIKRNPSNFKEIEAKRPEWDRDTKFRLTKCPDPDWTFGKGERKKSKSSDERMVEIDPHECGRKHRSPSLTSINHSAWAVSTRTSSKI